MVYQQATKFTFHQEVIDSISGLRGVVIGIAMHAGGDNQCLVQPRVDSDGNFAEAVWLPESRLAITPPKKDLAPDE